ncbi:MAG: ornithine cyclodeaminase family protein [Candidatus Hydrogenedentota bacterium]
MKTLILSRKDIEKLISPKEAIKVIEKAFYYYGKSQAMMPEKIYLNIEEYNGDFRAMPGYIKPLGSCGVKWVCSYKKNLNFKLPSVMAVLILNSPKNAYPLSIMDATYLTNLRTGAASAVATKYLARADAEVLAFVGCGVQAEFQFWVFKEVFKRLKLIKIYDINSTAMLSFEKKIKMSKFNVETSKNIEECVKDSNIVITTTPSRKPIIKFSYLKNGIHINAIGADARGKQELEIKILKNAKIVVDDYKQAMHSGEINTGVKKGIITRKDIYASLSEIITGLKKAREKEDEITVFDSTGLAIQDIAVASFVYRKAKKLKVGLQIQLI